MSDVRDDVPLGPTIVVDYTHDLIFKTYLQGGSGILAHTVSIVNTHYKTIDMTVKIRQK